TNELEPVAVDFWRLFEDEVKDLRERKDSATGCFEDRYPISPGAAGEKSVIEAAGRQMTRLPAAAANNTTRVRAAGASSNGSTAVAEKVLRKRLTDQLSRNRLSSASTSSGAPSCML